MDLTKVLSIRFQMQNIDGTENELIIQKILFSGNLNNLYVSPSEYIE